MLKNCFIYSFSIIFVLLTIVNLISASGQGIIKTADELGLTLTQQQVIDFNSGKGLTLEANQVNELKQIAELDLEGIAVIPIDTSIGQLSGNILKLSINDFVNVIASKIFGIVLTDNNLEIKLTDKRLDEINAGLGLDLSNSERSIIKNLIGVEVKDKYSLLLLGKVNGDLLQLPVGKSKKDVTIPAPSDEEYGGSRY